MVVPSLINNFLENSAEVFPDKIALIHGQTRATYREINNAADRLASWLISNQVQRGQRVVLLLENSLEYVIGYYGILKAGAVAVPLNTEIKLETLRNLLMELEPHVIISSFKFERLLQNADLPGLKITILILINPKVSWSSIPIQVLSWSDIIRGNPQVVNREAQGDLISRSADSCPLGASRQSQGEKEAERSHALPPSGAHGVLNRSALSGYGSPPTFRLTPYANDNPSVVSSKSQGEEAIERANALTPSRAHDLCETSLASIIYTSGSTGKPKGVMLSHRNIVVNTLAICRSLELMADDIQMVVLPFFYVMGQSLLNTHFAVGGTVIINNQFAFPATVLKEMVAEKVTGFSGVPSTYAFLLHRSPLAKYRDQLTALRYCSQAGGPMARGLKEKLREVLPNHTAIYIMYGATEAAARLSCLRPERFSEKMDSIGQAIEGVTLTILSEKGEPVPVGEIGELTAAGPNIMQGYWRDPGATQDVLRDDRYFTGDLAFEDKEGFFYIVGRKDEQLKVGGHRVNPKEVEEVLIDSGLLLEAVVLGIADDLLGQKMIALAVLVSEDSPEDLQKYCAQRLSKPKRPSEIRLVKALPKNAAGKIDKKKCRELVGIM